MAKAPLKENKPARLRPPEPPIEKLKPVEVVPVPVDTTRANWFDVFRLWLYEKMVDNLVRGANMNDPKTTVTGFLTGVIGLLAHFGIVFPEWLFTPVVLLGVVVLGYFSADKKPRA